MSLNIHDRMKQSDALNIHDRTKQPDVFEYS